MTSLSSFNSIQVKADAATASALPEGLLELQNRQRTMLEDISLPTRKSEHWKYSAKRLSGLQDLPASPWVNSTQNLIPYDCETLDITLENGQVTSIADTGDDVQCKRFAELNEEEIARLKAGVISKADDMAFAQFNQAGFQDGLYLTVKRKTQIQTPVRISVRQSQGGVANNRIFVLLEEQSALTLIEDIQIDALPKDQPALLNLITECSIGAGASLTYIRSDADLQDSARVIAATGVHQARDSRFESHCLGFGKHLDRHDLRVELAEPGAECSLNGVCLTQDEQHYDNHTCIEHLAPHCQSNENYRCIAGDRSQIVFNGRIHIHPDAQQTLGAMSNKNLLLSSGAEINAKPELEIYADDVKCAHGTTIGQLDEREVYYLKTRGIQDDQARQMLTLGFVLEVVRENPVSAISDYWENLLTNQLRFER